MATISILANTVRPTEDRRSDDTAYGAGTISWQYPVHTWKACPGEVMTEENLFFYHKYPPSLYILSGQLSLFGVKARFTVKALKVVSRNSGQYTHAL